MKAPIFPIESRLFPYVQFPHESTKLKTASRQQPNCKHEILILKQNLLHVKQNSQNSFSFEINFDKVSLPIYDKIRYTMRVRGRRVSTPYLEDAHLWDRLNKLKSVPQVCKHQRKEDVVMIFLEILSRIVSILVGVVTLAEKCKSYIWRNTGRTEKDPSASLPASDGSIDDCTSNR